MQYQWSRFDTVTTAAVALLALFTRFIGLNAAQAGGTPVFDEKHYVPQAWDIVRSWQNLAIGGIESNPGYGLVVHPPLAKQMIAWGEMLFGYSPMGWRVVTALCGVGVVLVIMAIARRLSGSGWVALFAGLLATFDGVLLVTSRFGMLDIIQVLFIVLACWALIRDWQLTESRAPASLQAAAGTHGQHEQSGDSEGDLTGTEATAQPKFAWRWWRIACGVFLGLALAVKWSGLYYMAFFGVLAVLLHARLAPSLRQWFLDSVRAFAALVLLPIAVYAWTWRAWFAQETSVYRHAASNGTIPADSWMQALPDALAGWVYYHSSVLNFHASLTTSSGHDHPFDSKPWEWLVGLKPILYLSTTDIACGEQTCRKMLYLFGTPIIWWLIVPVVLWALWAAAKKNQWRMYVIPLVGFAAGFIPWVASYDRQMYFFYATALIPFVLVMIACMLGTMRQSAHPALRIAVPVYLGMVIASFVLYSPILYGLQIPDSFYNMLMWLPAWR
ncbi:phospholipid carrier-dependent glycosyltransferase [Corynebacterium sp. 153RC1]|uniref:dolichyl-phosphate-mannose--protein mannosyltransferase n=1 Tax=unclassified Corynebacterium TaxID=2624378 RepID=UPI00211C7D83|nr:MULTISPECIES: phospholipid carrier-dependent glycosyltransferase [unclassified Corynebacterium]MCQ9352591.1 phospholipid carrier-dependent glycosyltransferase [Corynebacterium sp. 209RC1]MCQ9354775.1 phospholipid carrier-dependent glycosyltransferase [Corynebacterium sp. 1222RC1]MCQ9356960.1 phospholipid carrier-dependent glycosyltransferase [Corynebacterium sp. 122RC1]MCQ9359043.1 phospholipid carrier-dependent glycosyltransferase [Corynebacterium sp. 142RC1]MCQ9361428.1 phospholipid carri